MSIDNLINKYSNELKLDISKNSSKSETIILDGICRICKHEKNTILHHISYNPEKTMEVCHICHFKIHNNKKFKPHLTPSLSREVAQSRGLITKSGTLNPNFNITINDKELAKWIKNEINVNDKYEDESQLFEVAISKLKDNTYDDLQREICKNMVDDIILIQKIRNREIEKIKQNNYIIEALEEDILDKENIEWMNHAVRRLSFYNKSEVIKQALKNHKQKMTNIDIIL